jgi:hypothetical protein
MLPLIEYNKDFIADEIVLFFKRVYPEYQVDRELCRRDVHMVIDIVMGELHITGGLYVSDMISPDFCENYWQLNKYKTSFRVFRKQDNSTLDALQYTSDLIKLVLQNKAPITYGNTYKQIFDESRALPADTIEKVDSIISLIAANAAAGLERTPHIEFLEDYFDKGFVVTHTPQHIHNRLWEEINRTNWVPGKGTTYKTIPDWYVQKERRYIDPTGADRQVVERWEGLYGYYHAPQTLKDIAQDLIKDPIFDPLRLYRPPNAVPKFIHFWNGSENTQHHVDSIDGSDVMIFCYATEAPEWKEEWGGYINLMKEVGGEFHYLRNVMPDDRRMVIVNNAAPIFKHGIRNLINEEVNRYTYIFHYTWTYDE